LLLPSQYDENEVVTDKRKAIRNNGRKYLNPNKSEKIKAPHIETTSAPANDKIKSELRRIRGACQAIVLPQKMLLNIEIIDTFAITSAISPRPSLPHIRVVNTTRPKLASNIMNFEKIVCVVFLDNIL
jgi:hypothetical protein